MIYFDPMTASLMNLNDGLEEAKGFIENEEWDEAVDVLIDLQIAIRRWQKVKEEE